MADTSNTQEEKGQVIKLHDLRPAPGSKKAKTHVDYEIGRASCRERV